MPRTVTRTDRAIIRLLQRNARSSYAELSRQTGIPESTVRRRMERLQERGVIEFSMVADPSKLGFELSAMIGLSADLKELDAIAETLRKMPEVTFAAFVTGSFDVITQVVVEHQEGLVQLLQHLASIPGVRSTETFVMPWVIKPATAWILPETDGDTNEPEESDEDSDSSNQTNTDPPRRRGRPKKIA
jgi:Lrp/AsnC family transcriptional regulator, regulator for asnA, asnC and gidA